MRRYEAGIWQQGVGFVAWSKHKTLDLAVRAARKYARGCTESTGGAHSWSGGVRAPTGEVTWHAR